MKHSSINRAAFITAAATSFVIFIPIQSMANASIPLGAMKTVAGQMETITNFLVGLGFLFGLIKFAGDVSMGDERAYQSLGRLITALVVYLFMRFQFPYMANNPEAIANTVANSTLPFYKAVVYFVDILVVVMAMVYLYPILTGFIQGSGGLDKMVNWFVGVVLFVLMRTAFMAFF